MNKWKDEGIWIQWIILVLVIGGRDYRTPKRRQGLYLVYKRYILPTGWLIDLGGGFKYFFNVHPYLGKWSSLTNVFQMGWFNHQLVILEQHFDGLARLGWWINASRRGPFLTVQLTCTTCDLWNPNNPIGSTYGILTYISFTNQPNVGKYAGFQMFLFFSTGSLRKWSNLTDIFFKWVEAAACKCRTGPSGRVKRGFSTWTSFNYLWGGLDRVFDHFFGGTKKSSFPPPAMFAFDLAFPTGFGRWASMSFLQVKLFFSQLGGNRMESIFMQDVFPQSHVSTSVSLERTRKLPSLKNQWSIQHCPTKRNTIQVPEPCITTNGVKNLWQEGKPLSSLPAPPPTDPSLDVWMPWPNACQWDMMKEAALRAVQIWGIQHFEFL